MDASPVLRIGASYQPGQTGQIVRVTFEGQMTKTDNVETSTVSAVDNTFNAIRRRGPAAEAILDFAELIFMDQASAEHLAEQMLGLARTVIVKNLSVAAIESWSTAVKRSVA